MCEQKKCLFFFAWIIEGHLSNMTDVTTYAQKLPSMEYPTIAPALKDIVLIFNDLFIYIKISVKYCIP